MTRRTQRAAAVARMAILPYQLRAIADAFTLYRPGTASYATCLASYYAETIHILYDAHLAECAVADGDCQTCNGIRVGLTGIGADLLAAGGLTRLANQRVRQL
jgi:hypothetical protein